MVSAINEVNNEVARGVFLMGGEMEEKNDEENGVGKITEAVVGSAEKLAMWSIKIYQEEGNQMEAFIFTVDQYMETVEIFLQSLSPEIEAGNNVSKHEIFWSCYASSLLIPSKFSPEQKFKQKQPLCLKRAWKCTEC